MIQIVAVGHTIIFNYPFSIFNYYRATIQRCALHCVRIARRASRLLAGSLIIEVQNDTERKYYDNLRSMHELPAGHPGC